MTDPNEDKIEKKAERDKTRFTTKMVVASVTATTLFTIACFWLAVYNIDHYANVQIPTELTALFFTFWTVEIVSLASLDKTKIKNKYEKDDSQNNIGINTTQNKEN